MDEIPDVGALRTALFGTRDRPLTATEWQRIMMLVDRAVLAMRARGDNLGDVLMTIAGACHEARGSANADVLKDRATRAFYSE
jgi:hypothetical protein